MNPLKLVKEYRQSGLSWKGIYFEALKYFGIATPTKSFGENVKELAFLKIVKIKNTFAKTEKDANGILILQSGVLGDSLLALNAFQAIQKHCKQSGATLTLFCSNAMANIFKNYGELGECEYITFASRDNMKFADFKALVKQVRQKSYKHLVAQDNNTLAYRIAGAARAKEKLYYSYATTSRKLVDARLVKKNFTEIKEFPATMFIPYIWKEIAKRVGIENYQVAIGRLNVKGKPNNEAQILPKEKYILVCPEASMRKRSIDPEKCEAIIKYMQKNFPYKIALSTNARDKDYAQELSALAKKLGLLDYIGKTTMDSFVALVNGATLLFGCDSGQIHLAASLGVPSVCATGYWDLTHFFPYYQDYLRGDDKVPCVIYPSVKRDCAYCDEYHKGKSAECQKRILDGKSIQCIDDVSLEEIFTALNEALGKK